MTDRDGVLPHNPAVYSDVPHRQGRLQSMVAGSAMLAAALTGSFVGGVEATGYLMGGASNNPTAEATATSPANYLEIEASAAQAEKQWRDKFLEANQAQEIGTVETDSGITIRFYTDGNSELSGTKIDTTAINGLTSFAIDNLSNLRQNYLSPQDIVSLQVRAHQGELNNVNVAVLLCDGDYKHIDENTQEPVQNSCQEDDDGDGTVTAGRMLGWSVGPRSDANSYYPTLMISWSPNIEFGAEQIDVIKSKIPSSVTSEAQDLPFPGSGELYIGRGDSMTVILLHELTHIFPYLVLPPQNMNTDMGHTEVVTPTQVLGTALLAGLPGIHNLTQYDVRAAFRFPTLEERIGSSAESPSIIYPRDDGSSPVVQPG